MLVAPPMGTTKTPSWPRLRPLRAASASIADWSLTPSTRMTAHEPAGRVPHGRRGGRQRGIAAARGPGHRDQAGQPLVVHRP